MRRLPVYFVLDCSESMVGEKITQMEVGLTSIIRSLRTDPHALETVHVSVIAFAGVAKKIVPLVELVNFYTPKLPIGGGTSLGAALCVLMESIDTDLIRTSVDTKGDWRPIVYLFSDGHPTDNYSSTVDKWIKLYSSRVTLVAVSIGNGSDLTVLKKLTDNVIIFDGKTNEAFDKFIKWVTASIVVHSKSLGEGLQPNFIELDDSCLKVVKDATISRQDDTCVTLVGRCRKTKNLYIIKYEQKIYDLSVEKMNLNVDLYELEGCFPLSEDYFLWTDAAASTAKVNTTKLNGSPGCPHCGSLSAFAVCGCGKLMCLDGPGQVTCPWCENKVFFSPVKNNGQGLNVTKGRG